MPKSGQSRAEANKAIRQEALRQQLAGQGHIQYVVENINKIEALDPTGGNETALELNIIKTANEQRMKLVNKYLPDLKSTEITGEGGGAININDMSKWSESQIDEYIAKHS